ncbi:aspartate/glutamate racemase family protein [Oceanisphaera arctica]|uniref:Aspartate racemase n=1 Tax=Oceanisphaera arctica TaxID=641510 RepID=A0A2P5TNB6_9GAMM|nr:amino acid racemase [Oceanisphaera arctica]PPL16986.1 aspartate racemase [Oceanisphaera arctica]
MSEQTVGVIGGMGPEATVDLMRRVIAATPAWDDIDHIHMLVDNNPKVPSRIKALIEGTGESPAPFMAKMARGLERAGVDFLVIPCNTAHMYYPEVVAAVSIPVVNILDVTVQHVKRCQPNIRKVGMLASTAVENIRLYHDKFDVEDVETLFPSPEHQDNVMELIKRVKAKTHDADILARYHEAAEDLKSRGAECLVLACTELSVISDKLTTDLPVYDASQLLAEHIVYRVKGTIKESA